MADEPATTGREAILADELRILRSRLETARQDVLDALASSLVHVHDNARRLAQYDVNEARCRELAALYLEEALEICRIGDRTAALDALLARSEALRLRVRAALAEVDAVRAASEPALTGEGRTG